MWATQNGLEGKGPEELATEEALIAAIQAGVDEANAKMSRVEQIKKFKVLPTEWVPRGDELTPTMKLKRKPIAEKYEGEIEELYWLSVAEALHATEKRSLARSKRSRCAVPSAAAGVRQPARRGTTSSSASMRPASPSILAVVR